MLELNIVTVHRCYHNLTQHTSSDMLLFTKRTIKYLLLLLCVMIVLSILVGFSPLVAISSFFKKSLSPEDSRRLTSVGGSVRGLTDDLVDKELRRNLANRQEYDDLWFLGSSYREGSKHSEQLEGGTHLEKHMTNGNNDVIFAPDRGSSRRRFISKQEIDDLVSSGLNKQAAKSETNRPVRVIIASNMKSGSSFVGATFNEHSKVFYHYEPLHVFRAEAEVDSIPYTCIDSPDNVCEHQVPQEPLNSMLTDLFQCKFPGYYLSYLNNPERVHFRHMSSAMMQTPICPEQPFSYPYPIFCPPVTFQNALQSCLFNHTYTVVKTIRVGNLKHLRPLVEDPRFDVRIIHLLRDPRAVAFSRLHSGATTNDMLETDTRYMCSKMLRNIRIGQTKEQWLKGHYMPVYFEDIAKNPMKEMRKMFKFSGISFSSEVKQFLTNNTFYILYKRNWNVSTKDTDIEKITNRWRDTVEPGYIDQIQAWCAPFFTANITGYFKVKHASDVLGPGGVLN